MYLTKVRPFYLARVLCLIITLLSINLFARNNIEREEFYDKIYNNLKSSEIYKICETPSVFTCEEQGQILTDAFISLLQFDKISTADLKFILKNYPWGLLSAADKIKLDEALKIYTRSPLIRRSLNIEIKIGAIKTYRDALTNCILNNKSCERINLKKDFQWPSKAAIKSLVFESNQVENYKEGRYKGKPQIFIFCRTNRKYPCRLFLKNNRGELVKSETGQLWSLPMLAKSIKNRPYYKVNGQTPVGVYTVDSVMPKTNKKASYGDYRRLILNFITPSEGEAHIKWFMPKSHHSEDWWQEAVIARDMGRQYLRIHGTGWRNLNPWSKHYPFVPTRGCVTTREGFYFSEKYKDQKILLNKLLVASQLNPDFESQTKLRAIMYLINIDDRSKPVRESDLESILEL